MIRGDKMAGTRTAAVAFSALALMAGCKKFDDVPKAAQAPAAKVAVQAQPKLQEPEERNFEDHFSRAKPDPRPAPRPLEKTLLESMTVQVASVQNMLAKPLHNGPGSCIIELRQATPVFYTLALAEAYNQMVRMNMPGYAGREVLPSPGIDRIAEYEERLRSTGARCRAEFGSIASPNLDYLADNMSQQQQPIDTARSYGSMALDRMGHSMLEYAYMSSLDPRNSPVPDGKFCRAMFKIEDLWSHALNQMPKGTAQENMGMQRDNFTTGVFRLCTGPGAFFK